MVNWEEITEKAGFGSEREIWDRLYVMENMGTAEIEKWLLNRQNGCYVSRATILSRLKKLGYEIKPHGFGQGRTPIEPLKGTRFNGAGSASGMAHRVSGSVKTSTD